MGINLGNSSISSFKLGSNSVSKVYLGNNLIWPSCVESSLLLHFDGNNEATSFVDSSINNLSVSGYDYIEDPNAISILSNEQKVFGATSLKPNGGAIYVPYNAVFNIGTDDFTIECWFYIIDYVPDMRLFSYGNWNKGVWGPTTGHIGVSIQGGSNIPELLDQRAGIISRGETPVNTNQWYHLAVSRSNNNLRLLLDGIVQFSIANTSNFNSTNNITIGGMGATDGSYIYSFNGYIDDFRFIKGLGVYDGDSIVPNSSLSACASKSPNPSYGTFISSSCLSGSLAGYYADGNGGRYTQTISAGSCTGWDGFVYYVDGVKTDLNNDGDGFWNNLLYDNGLLYTGYAAPTYYVNGEASSLDQYGNGYWATTDKYYLGGIETTLNSDGDGCWDYGNYDNGSVVPPQNAGYDSCSETYWLDIGGVITDTSLDSNGNGYWNLTDKYYIGGVETTLDSSGSGYWNSQAYYNGSPQSTGWNGYYYYIDNIETTLDSNGNGYWATTDKYYLGGTETTLDPNGDGCYNNNNYASGSIVPVTTEGWDSCTNKYYLTYMSILQETTLDSSGNGYWNNQAYYNGSPQSTGWNGYYYYIDNVETTLGQNGDGCWNGYVYYGGVISEETC